MAVNSASHGLDSSPCLTDRQQVTTMSRRAEYSQGRQNGALVQALFSS